MMGKAQYPRRPVKYFCQLSILNGLCPALCNELQAITDVLLRFGMAAFAPTDSMNLFRTVGPQSDVSTYH